MPQISFLILLLFACLSPANAQFPLSGGKDSSTAVMVPENSAIAPGKPFTVALKLSHPEGWHSYYKNSGGLEIPPAITWTLPDGFSAGEIQWPVPEIKEGDLGKSLIYSGSPVFLTEITPPASLPAGQTLTLTAKATWQICKTSCKDESKTFTLTLPSAGEPALDSAQGTLFENARSSLPPANQDWSVTSRTVGGNLELVLSPVADRVRALSSLTFDFIPDQPFIDPAIKVAATRDGDNWVIPLARRTEDALGEPIPQASALSGILVSHDPALSSFTVAETTLDAAASPPPPSGAAAAGPEKKSPAYLPILGFMLIGGLILNLMPCVFPVIGIKILGFVQQAGHDRKKIIIHGLIFAAGVLASFWVLAAALFAGGITNWGNQLQDPRVILVTIVIMLLFGMNLYGVFELGTSATGIGGNLTRKDGPAGTFFSGVLATVIATPCSGPYLGVAIGAAATLPAIPFFLAFTAMAVGLALPYLVLSAFPSLLEKLPRPGPWMESFKQAMSFFLFAAAGVFLWVYSAQIFDRNDGQKGLWVMLGLSIVAAAGWVYGRWNAPTRTTTVRNTGRAVALLLLTLGISAAWPWEEKPASAESGHLAIDWKPWSQEAVDKELAAGNPVFIDFTAKWCFTCQLNKKRAYTEAVTRLIKEKNIVTFRADKTNPDPAIEAKLNEFGRTAIPVNVLLVPGKAEPIITPELLSPDYLIELFTTETPGRQP